MGIEMETPKISIIVPVYNVEKYLPRCIKSLLDQTYKNTEIILVDDGSPDNSGKICDEYSEKYKNIKTFHKENQGLGMARNTGLEHATGKYVTFVDSDDWLDTDLLSKLYEYLVKYKVEAVIGSYKRVDRNGNIMPPDIIYNENVFYGEQVKKEFLPRIIGRSPEKRDNLGVSSCGRLFSTDVIQKFNVKFESERIYMSEDLLFNIDYFSYANSVAIAPIYGYNYFMNIGTLSTRYRTGRLEKYQFLFEVQKEKLEKINIYDEVKYRLCCQYFVRIKNSIIQENTKISGKSYREAIANINAICEAPLYRELITMCPKEKLGFKQNVFLWLVMHKCSHLLYILLPLM